MNNFYSQGLEDIWGEGPWDGSDYNTDDDDDGIYELYIDIKDQGFTLSLAEMNMGACIVDDRGYYLLSFNEGGVLLEPDVRSSIYDLGVRDNLRVIGMDEDYFDNKELPKVIKYYGRSVG